MEKIIYKSTKKTENKYGKYSPRNFLIDDNDRPKEFIKMKRIYGTLVSEDKDKKGRYSFRSEYAYNCELSLIRDKIECEISILNNELNDLRKWLPHNLPHYITLLYDLDYKKGGKNEK